MGEVAFSPSLDRFEDGAGRELIRLGHRLVDGYLELVAGRRSQTVEGLTGGVKYVFRITARTSTGWQSKSASIGAAPPAAPDSDLTLEISVPAYCLADEGRQHSGYDANPDTGLIEEIYWRTEVATVPLQWRITGGKAPYSLTVAGTEHTGASGATEVSCARAGLDLADLPELETNVIEAGPKTLTIQAADATGDTTTKTHTIEIIEGAESAGWVLDGDYLEPGRTYYLFRLFIEIPEGTRIGYTGADDGTYDIYHGFIEPLEGSRTTDLLVSESTGEEAPVEWSRTVYRVTDAGGIIFDFGVPLTDAENAFWDRFLTHVRLTPFPEGDPRNEPPDPLAPSDGRAARQAAAAAPQCSDDGTTLMDFTSGRWRPYGQIPGTTLMDFTSGRWRPYGQIPGTTPVRHGLSCDRKVAAHPSLLVGDAITVCISGGARDGLLVPAVATAAGDWNDLLAPDHANPDPSLRRGLGYAPFSFDAASPDCPADLMATDTDHVQVFDARHCHANTGTDCLGGARPAVARTRKSLDPPRIEWNLMRIDIAAGSGNAASERETAIRRELERLVRHELGHFLGLADYFAGCWRLVDGAGTVQPSAMSYGRLAGDTPDGTRDPAGCRSDDAVTARDLADLHAIYHPLAVSELRLDRIARPRTLPADRPWRLRWKPSAVTPPVFNAARLGVVRREVLTAQPVGGMPSGPAAWELFDLHPPKSDHYVLPGSADVQGYEYAVLGLTRGDHRHGERGGVGLRLSHRALAQPGERAWTAGGVSSSVSATPAQIAIAGPEAPITEGVTAVFTVSRIGATSSPLAISVRVAETGEMVAAADQGSQFVTIPVGASSATFEVSTVAAAPTVGLTIAETGDMVASADEGPTSVAIRAGESSATLEVATDDDGLDEDGSTVAAALARSRHYAIGAPGSATVTVDDNDP